MPSRLQIAIGAVKDQTSISLAKVNGSSNLQVAVLKATTHNDLSIDERYVHEILHLVSSNKTDASACARAICKRITRTRNWVVALKSLVLVLRILQDGDPYFPREIVHATEKGASLLNLSSFSDGSGSWDYTAFVQTFGLYLEERLECFLTGKLQRRCSYNEIKGSKRFRKKSNDFVRDMKPAMLIDRIGYWQRLLERAIATRPTSTAKDNPLVKIAVYAAIRESFDLYRDISDGLDLIIDVFVSLPYELCVRAFEICVKAETQFQELEKFYSACKKMGVARNSEYPTVKIISAELIKTLQEILNDKPSPQPDTKTPRKQSVSPGVGSSSKCQKSCREQQSQFSGISSLTEMVPDGTSESGSERKNESIDIEACSGQSKRSRQEELFRMSKTCKTQSLPVTNSIVNLSSDDWPANKKEKEDQEMQQGLVEPILVDESSHSTSTNSQLQSSSSKDSEDFLAERVTPSSPPTHTGGNRSGAFASPQATNDGLTGDWGLVLEQRNTSKADILSDSDAIKLHNQPQLSKTRATKDGSTDGWELVLKPRGIRQADILSNLDEVTSHKQHQPPLSPINHYNRFLQDVHDIPAVNSSPEMIFWSMLTMRKISDDHTSKGK